MKIIALILIFNSVFGLDVDVDDDGVLVLDDSNFDDAVAENENILVEFYAPWCGHCKRLEPEWAKAAKTLVDQPVKLAKCDATVATKLAERFGVRGFPTIKFFRNGNPSEYGGGRTASEIVSWVQKKVGPVTTTISTLEDLAKFDESNDVFILGVFSSMDSRSAKLYLDIAAADDSLPYASTTSLEIKNKLALKSSDAVVIIKDFDDKRADLEINDGVGKTHISSFIVGNSVPLVQEFSMENSKKIFASPVKVRLHGAVLSSLNTSVDVSFFAF